MWTDSNLCGIFERSLICLLQVADLLAFRHKSNVIMAYGSSGSGKTFTIEVCYADRAYAYAGAGFPNVGSDQTGLTADKLALIAGQQ